MLKKQTLTLSIIIPVYNEEDYLGTCLQSIARQSVKPDEVIVVDNNSTDRSVQIAREFPFVKVIKEARQGIVFARNAGFDQATSQILARIDADTQLPASWVAEAKQIASIVNEKDAVTGPCSLREVPMAKISFWFHRIIYFWSSKALFGHHVLFGSNMFLFRSQWQAIRSTVCPDTTIHEDMDLAHHVALQGGKVYFKPEFIASISPRRFSNWQRYPGMWLKSRCVHYSKASWDLLISGILNK